MRGFVVGSLALIVLYTVINRAEAAGQVLTGSQDLVRRLLSSDVAAVPNFAGAKAAAAAPAPGKAAAPSSSTANPTIAAFVQPTVTTPAGLAPTTTSHVLSA